MAGVDLSEGMVALARKQAGFRSVTWHEPRVSPDGQARYGEAFWQAFLNASAITFIECVK